MCLRININENSVKNLKFDCYDLIRYLVEFVKFVYNDQSLMTGYEKNIELILHRIHPP